MIYFVKGFVISFIVMYLCYAFVSFDIFWIMSLGTWKSVDRIMVLYVLGFIPTLCGFTWWGIDG